MFSKRVLIFIFTLFIIILFFYNRKKIFINTIFTLYDINCLYGLRWKLDSAYCSSMKNNFTTPIPLNYYKEFNKYIFPRIINGNNNINKKEIKNVSNKMLNYLKYNNVEKSKSKQLPIIDVRIDDIKKIKLYISKNIPFVIRGIDLDIFNNYNFNTLINELKDEEVLFSPSPPYCMEKQYNKFENIKTNKCYLSNITSIFKKHPNIFNEKDIKKIEKLSGGKMNSKQMFVSAEKGSGTRLHCAFTNNFFINVVGEKKWTFFNPNNTPMLYPYFSKYGIYNTSESRFLSYDDIDLNKFPLFNYVDHYVYTIKPKEILYNPASWWHSVKNETKETFALSTRWTFYATHLLDSHLLRYGNLCNKNLRKLISEIYYNYGIIGINVIDEHNIMGDSKENKIPMWDKMTNDNHLLCLNKDCHLNWH